MNVKSEVISLNHIVRFRMCIAHMDTINCEIVLNLPFMVAVISCAKVNIRSSQKVLLVIFRSILGEGDTIRAADGDLLQ